MHLVLAQPAKQLVATFGEHGATKAWLPVGSEDPWHRDGAFFGWDAVGNQRATQERRVYMSGLSDEAGAGAGLAMAVKQLGAPSAAEVGLLEQYVQHTLYQGDHPERGHFLQAPCPHLHISLDLPTSPYVSLRLAISPYLACCRPPRTTRSVSPSSTGPTR